MSVVNIWTIIKKELRHYFGSVLAYVILFIFLLSVGAILVLSVFPADEVSLRPMLNFWGFLIPMLFIVFISAFAMRSFSEEKRQGTLELLVTMPLQDIEIVIGKMLGALSFLLVVIALMLIYPLTISMLGELDWGPVWGAYLGLYLLGASILAIGMFTSSITDSQIVAFILGVTLSVMLYWVGKFLVILPAGLHNVVGFIGFDQHFENIAKGVIDSRDVLYYLSMIFFFDFLALQSLANRKK